jgi:hypothetical protein
VWKSWQVSSARPASSVSVAAGLLEGIESAWLPDGRENWIRWTKAVESVSGDSEAAVLGLLEGETRRTDGVCLGYRAHAIEVLAPEFDHLDSTSVVGLVCAGVLPLELSDGSNGLVGRKEAVRLIQSMCARLPIQRAGAVGDLSP